MLTKATSKGLETIAPTEPAKAARAAFSLAVKSSKGFLVGDEGYSIYWLPFWA